MGATIGDNARAFHKSSVSFSYVSINIDRGSEARWALNGEGGGREGSGVALSIQVSLSLSLSLDPNVSPTPFFASYETASFIDLAPYEYDFWFHSLRLDQNIPHP